MSKNSENDGNTFFFSLIFGCQLIIIDQFGRPVIGRPRLRIVFKGNDVLPDKSYRAELFLLFSSSSCLPFF